MKGCGAGERAAFSGEGGCHKAPFGSAAPKGDAAGGLPPAPPAIYCGCSIPAIARLPELLAPAGNLETALAAFAAGADAVYAGLTRFSARARAENFTFDALGRLIEYAHTHAKRVHVAFNTLLVESELSAARRALAELAELSPDAVIVQDLGVLELIRREFPALTVHASTQMGIHNSAGVRLLAANGVKRVILERQVTLAELRKILPQSPVEIEVFLHGSLCVSLSGRCLVSAALEGASGNRGRCKQLCRRLYRQENGQSGFYLSPLDLDGAAVLPELCRLGVASLKLEGRLRGPDYVFPLVSAYRRMLDALPGRDQEAEAALATVVSRRTGSGFWEGFEKRIAAAEPGGFGRMAATVKTVSPRGMTVRTATRLHVGDKLRIVGADGSAKDGFLLTSLYADRRKVSSVPPNMLAEIGGRFQGAPGDAVFKTGEAFRDFSRQAAALPPRRHGLELKIRLDSGGLTVAVERTDLIWRHDFTPESAQRAPVTAAALKELFTHGAPEPWRIDHAEAEVNGSWFLAVQIQKELRRRFWEEAAPRLAAAHPAPAAAMAEPVPPPVPVKPQQKLSAYPKPGMTVPGFIAETALPEWRKKIRAAWDAGCRIFEAQGFGALALLQELPETERIITAAPPLAATNSAAAAWLLHQSVAAVRGWVELPETELKALQETAPIWVAEPPDAAAFPVLATRVRLPASGVITDRQGRKLEIARDATEGLTVIRCATADYRKNSEY